MWTSLIASIIGITLRQMSRSRNDTISEIGSKLGMSLMIFAVIYLIIF